MIYKLSTASFLEILDAPNSVRIPTDEKNEWNFSKRPGMMYFVARGVSTGMNNNGDYFSREELQKNYQSFVRKGFFVNHQSSDVEKQRGTVIDTKLVDNGTADGNMFVKCLIEFNEEAYPELAKMIRSGHITDVSMGIVFDTDSAPAHLLMEDLSSKRYKDIVIGDKVITRTGCSGEVVAVGQEWKENAESYKFSVTNFDNFVVSKDHKLLVLEMLSDKEEYIAAEDIKKGDYLLSPILNGHKAKTLRLFKMASKSAFIFKNYIALPVTNIEKQTYTGLGYNIQVGSDENPNMAADHSYVLNGIVSKNCQVGYSTCSICNHRAKVVAEYCNHIKLDKGGYLGGKQVYEINHDIDFQELSLVVRGADPNAKILQVLAKKAMMEGKDMRVLIARAFKDATYVDSLREEDAKLKNIFFKSIV